MLVNTLKELACVLIATVINTAFAFSMYCILRGMYRTLKDVLKEEK